MRLKLLVAAAVILAAIHAAAEAPGISCPEFRRSQLARESFVLIDVRPPAEFLAAHIPGAQNIPVAGIQSAGLPRAGKLVVYCGETPCPLSKEAAERLLAGGYADVRVLDGGLGAWRAQGFPVEKSGAPQAGPSAGKLGAKEAHKRIKKGTLAVVDVRPALEFSAGHLPGAVSVPLEELPGALGRLDQGREVLVYDRLADRSRKAGEILAVAGYKVSELSGGLAGWAARKLPLEVK